jgi:hypothetical protein
MVTRAVRQSTSGAPNSKAINTVTAAKAESGGRAKVAKPNEAAADLRQPASPLSFDEIEVRIRDRAYELWVQRGRVHGYATEDWLQAEKECADSTSKLATRGGPSKMTRVPARKNVK